MSNNNDDNASYIARTNKGQSFAGTDVNIFGALALASAIKMYVSTNGALRASRMHTVKNMCAGAKVYTGKTYTKKTLAQAAEDLTDYADTLKLLPRNIADIEIR